MERLIRSFHILISGHIIAFKEQFKFYFDDSIESKIGKQVYESINVLFTLRNVLAHGTTLIQPKYKMDETLKDIYPYKWQTKLQDVDIYLEKNFGKGSIIDNLACHSVPEHFINATKELFLILEKNYSPFTKRIKNTTDMLKQYSFGKRYYTN